MKKIFLTLAIIAFSTTAFSQVKIRPGVKLGLNLAKLSNANQATNKLGINGGLFLNVHLSSFYELQVETTYSDQGTTYKFQNQSQNTDPLFSFNNDQDLNLEYISLGIANKFFPVKNNGLNLIVGPSIDILVSNNYNTYYLPIDFSLFAGAGYEFPFGLGLEIRYKQGLLDVRDDYYVDSNNNNYNDNVLNGVIQIGASYRFGF